MCAAKAEDLEIGEASGSNIAEGTPASRSTFLPNVPSEERLAHFEAGPRRDTYRQSIFSARIASGRRVGGFFFHICGCFKCTRGRYVW